MEILNNQLPNIYESTVAIVGLDTVFLSQLKSHTLKNVFTVGKT